MPTIKKIAVVSGGTKGIGLAICNQLVDEGFQVFSSARNIENQENSSINYFKADLSTKKGVREFASYIKSKTDKVDILVNNVGVFIPGKLMEEEEGIFEKQINTNLASTYHLTRALISDLRKSEKAYIFNICSTASIIPYPNGGSYCISKYAQLGFTKVLREELKEENIKVSAVMPGATLTNSWAGSDLPKERFIQPKSIAQLISAAYKLSDSTVMEEIVVRPLGGDIS